MYFYLDLLLIVLTVSFVTRWWLKNRDDNRKTLVALGSAVVAFSVLAIFEDRWQAYATLGTGIIFLVTLFLKRKTQKRPYFSGSSFVLLTLASTGLLLLFPINDLPAPSGPHLVGTRSFDLVDTSRTGVLAAKENEPRKLLVRVWYPTTIMATKFPKAPYFHENEKTTTAASVGSMINFSPLFTHLVNVNTNSHIGAPLRTTPEKLPTIFYSHGYTSFAGQNTMLMEELASHGYVVYSIHHTYDGSAVTFTDGQTASMDPNIFASGGDETEGHNDQPQKIIMDYFKVAFGYGPIEDKVSTMLDFYELQEKEESRILVKSAKVWLDDRFFVHDQLEKGFVPANIEPIAAASNFASTGQMGMSFGGSTTGAICIVDRRCAAGINLDGLDYHLLPINTDMPVPFMVMHSDLKMRFETEDGKLPFSFNDYSYASFTNAGKNEDTHRFYVRHSMHLGYSDFSEFIRRPLKDIFLGATHKDMMRLSQNIFVRDFFDTYLKGKEKNFPDAQLSSLNGEVVSYSNVRLSQAWNGISEETRQNLTEKANQLKARQKERYMQREAR